MKDYETPIIEIIEIDIDIVTGSDEPEINVGDF